MLHLLLHHRVYSNEHSFPVHQDLKATVKQEIFYPVLKRTKQPHDDLFQDHDKRPFRIRSVYNKMMMLVWRYLPTKLNDQIRNTLRFLV